MTNLQLIALLGGIGVTALFYCLNWSAKRSDEFAEAARDEGQTKTESEVRPVKANHVCASKSNSRFRPLSAAENN